MATGKRGGKRPGAGRPRKQQLTVVQPSVAAAAVVPIVVAGEVPAAPASMSAAARAVWDRQAAEAHREGTLTSGTVADFAATCELAVQTDVAQSAVAAATAGSQEWVQYSRIYLAYARDLAVKWRAFRLAPNGLPMVKADEGKEKPKSALEQMKERRKRLHAVR